jgi:hypothetical protein
VKKSYDFFAGGCFREEIGSGKFGLCFFEMKGVRNFCSVRFHDEKASRKFNSCLFLTKNDEKFLQSLFS